MNQYIRYTIAVLFAIIGGTICLRTNTQLGENIIFNGIETLVSASILGGYIYFLFNPKKTLKTMLLTMIGIVGGCISYSMTNYTLPLQLSSAFFHGLWTWFIAFCLADVFNLYKTMKKIAVAKLKVTLKLEDTLPAFHVGLHIPHHDKRSYPHGNFFSTYPLRIH